MQSMSRKIRLLLITAPVLVLMIAVVIGLTVSPVVVSSQLRARITSLDGTSVGYAKVGPVESGGDGLVVDVNNRQVHRGAKLMLEVGIVLRNRFPIPVKLVNVDTTFSGRNWILYIRKPRGNSMGAGSLGLPSEIPAFGTIDVVVQERLDCAGNGTEILAGINFETLSLGLVDHSVSSYSLEPLMVRFPEVC